MKFPTLSNLLAGGLAACSVFAAAVNETTTAIGIRDAQLTLASADGSNQHVQKLEYPQISLEPWVLEPDSVFKLSFGIIDVSSDKPFVPQHAHIRFTDVETAATKWLPVQIKDKGKARFDLKPSSLPASLRSSSGTHTLTLLLGHPSNAIRALEYTFGTLTLPSSRLLPLPKKRHDLSVKKEGEPAFVVQPEIQWTFNKEEKMVGKGVSAVGTAIVVGLPLAVWALTGGQVLRNLKTQSPTLTSLLFLVCLIGLEGLILKYWVNWRLYQFLPPFLGLGLVSAYIGKVALGQVQKRRVAAQTGSETRGVIKNASEIVVEKETSGKGAKVGIVKTK